MTFRTRLFQSWFRFSRPMTLGVRGLVTKPDGRILLIKHTYVEGWYFPGGGVEKGEPCEVALERELLEEAGVILRSPPLLIGVYSNHANFPNDHVLLYRVEDYEMAEPTAVGEIAEIGFFSVETIPQDTTPGTVRRIEEFLGHAERSNIW